MFYFIFWEGGLERYHSPFGRGKFFGHSSWVVSVLDKDIAQDDSQSFLSPISAIGMASSVLIDLVPWLGKTFTQ